jgi:hypothetical protein
MIRHGSISCCSFPSSKRALVAKNSALQAGLVSIEIIAPRSTCEAAWIKPHFPEQRIIDG